MFTDENRFCLNTAVNVSELVISQGEPFVALTFTKQIAGAGVGVIVWAGITLHYY